VLGTLAMGAARARAGMLDLVASYAISTATSPYLEQIGADLGIAPYVFTLIPPAAYQQLLLAISGSRPEGGSVQTLATEVAALLAGAAPAISTSVSGGLLSVQATQSGPGTSLSGPVRATQSAPWTLTMQIPFSPWPGLPGLPEGTARATLRALVGRIAPMGVQITMHTPDGATF